MANKYAYITCLTTENYIPGLFCIKFSLEKNKSNFPLFTLIPKDRKELIETVSSFGFNVIPFDNIKVDFLNKDKDYCHWNETFFKLNIARLTNFEKIVFLDLDLYIRKNIDELFLKPSFSAVCAGQICRKHWSDLNSGLLVLEPSLDFYEKLLLCIPDVIEKAKANNGQIGDQDIFIKAIENWPANDSLHLPEIYNEYYLFCSTLAKTLKNKWSDIKIIHFWGTTKIWFLSKIVFIKHLIHLLLKGELRLVFILINYRRILAKCPLFKKYISER